MQWRFGASGVPHGAGDAVPAYRPWEIGLVTAVAVLAGLLASISQPIVLAVFVGGFLSLFLLSRIDFAVWLLLAGTLVVNGAVLLMFPRMTKLSWALSMLGFFLLAAGLFSLFLGRRRERVRLPGFLMLFLVLVALSAGTSLLGKGSVLEILAGIKRSYQMLGLALALAVAPVTGAWRRHFQAWGGFLLFAAILQLPVALYERIVLVPLRVGMGGGIVPIDIVSGTFEPNFEGGGENGTMVIFLVVCLAYVLTAWRERALSSLWTSVFVVELGVPLFLGETKIALVLLPMMFLQVFSREIRRKPLVAAAALTSGALFTVVLAWLYFSAFAIQGKSPEQMVQNTIDYNFGSAGYYGNKASLNRTTVLTFWLHEHGLHNPVETLFGHGMGASYAGAGTLVEGHLNRKYPAMAINLNTASTLLWDSGVVGATLFLGVLATAWRASGRLLSRCADGAERGRLVALRVCLAANVFSLWYSNSLMNSPSHELLFAFTLGYLAWLARADLPKPSPENSSQRHEHQTALSHA
ncbi:hypothetical protein [Methylococcus geothermalis]|uniref:hypothetical protein n=1 Tax=Methylococcus geothermalis TaxID=2681310 RepID=UPI001E3E9943|nr:hypothetical protein [Methylococcus geothermalis]